MTDRLSSELGPYRWSRGPEGSVAGCRGDLANLDGDSRSPADWRFEGNLPDAEWPRAVEIVHEVTGGYGFAPYQTILDRPGRHEVSGIDRYGATYSFGTVGNTLISVTTGCHPRQAPG